MTNYPLLFGRHEKVEGDGFIARVAVAGRVLLAASGGSANEALAQFGRDFLAVLYDIASDAKSFEHFREQVEKFFNDTSAPALKEWEEAVQQVRTGQLDAAWLAKRPAESRLGIQVTLFSQPSATNNDLGEVALAA
jgi:hypothetical protein